MNRQKQEVIEYLRTENQVYKEKFGKKRISRHALASGSFGGVFFTGR